MAGASMNDIKARMKSVRSTMQITKAMELVATSKLRRAKEKAERSRPFHELLHSAIDYIDSSDELKESVWSGKREIKKTLYIVLAGDRGLAGGYNSNIFRLVEALSKDGEAAMLPVGKKALEYYRHRDREIYTDAYEYISELSVGDALAMAETVADGYKAGEFDHVLLVYTKFVSMISQLPTTEQLLPLSEGGDNTQSSFDPIYGGDPEEILDKILPYYLGGIINSAVCEALASESGARRTSMNAANKNASEMIDSLMLSYNRARQAVVTQEITEIVSGSEAL